MPSPESLKQDQQQLYRLIAKHLHSEVNMGSVTDQGLAIGEIAAFGILLIINIFVLVRHGFKRQTGFIFLFIFSAVRVAGGVLQVVGDEDDNTDVLEWATIMKMVGLTPLLLASLGILGRLVFETSTTVPTGRWDTTVARAEERTGLIKLVTGRITKTHSRRHRLTMFLSLPAIIALILSINGGIDEFSDDDQSSGLHLLRAAMIMYLIIYILLVVMCLSTLKDYSRMIHSQERMMFGLLIALPFLACRLIYSMIGCFGHDSRFSPVGGDPTLMLCMATIEEFIIVVTYTFIGLFTPPVKVPTTDKV